ncbi:MAG: hypothetical protein ACFCD0_27990 [Gemmataceae bacterium]
MASTEKRKATASGHNWVVVAVAIDFAVAGCPVLAFPIAARLHQSGEGHKTPGELAIEMVHEIASWVPNLVITLVTDGAYACELVVGNSPQRTTLISLMRSHAVVYGLFITPARTGQPGRKAKKRTSFGFSQERCPEDRRLLQGREWREGFRVRGNLRFQKEHGLRVANGASGESPLSVESPLLVCWESTNQTFPRNVLWSATNNPPASPRSNKFFVVVIPTIRPSIFD